MSREEAQAFQAKHRIHYFTEVSAKTGNGISALVEHIAKTLYHLNKDSLDNPSPKAAMGSFSSTKEPFNSSEDKGFLRGKNDSSKNGGKQLQKKVIRPK